MVAKSVSMESANAGSLDLERRDLERYNMDITTSVVTSI